MKKSNVIATVALALLFCGCVALRYASLRSPVAEVQTDFFAPTTAQTEKADLQTTAQEETEKENATATQETHSHTDTGKERETEVLTEKTATEYHSAATTDNKSPSLTEKITEKKTTSTTKAIPSVSATTAPKRTDAEEISEVLRIVNGYRSKVLCVKLSLDEDLCNAAAQRAEEMAQSGNFSHTRPDGRSCKTVMADNGLSYGLFGENIAYGQTSAEQVCKEWKNSPTHYKVLTKREFRKTGIGMARNEEGVIYWCQLFSD